MRSRSQLLFVETAGLPAPLVNQIKRLAAFQNPELYKKQAMRLSTALTPRVINCAEDLPQHVGLPRGCLAGLQALLGELGVDLDSAKAANSSAWRISSSSNSGYSRLSSARSGYRAAASTTRRTVRRMPRIQGWPFICSGLMVMRSNGAFKVPPPLRDQRQRRASCLAAVRV